MKLILKMSLRYLVEHHLYTQKWEIKNDFKNNFIKKLSTTLASE